MNPSNPSAQSMLPPQQVASLVRNNMSPTSLFPQNPLATGMTPNAMGADPSLMQQPPVGSQAMDPTQPNPQAGMQQPNAGVPGGQPQQISESQMILNVLEQRLQHHSKVTEKTLSTLQKMIEAGLPVPDTGQNSPTA